MPASSAETHPADGHAAPSFLELHQAWMDCLRRKRGTESALRFELRLENHLVDLYEQLLSGVYRPGKSICFVIKHPKPREVWAADFRDRIVHHLLYNRIGPRFERRFIADSCACIKGRGTLYAVERLDSKIRSLTENWSKPGFYLKCDIANFFVAIDKDRLWRLLEPSIPEPFWRDLARTVLFHDPRQNYEYRGDTHDLHLVPRHKRLTEQDAIHGLPIGNLSSQFFANVYMDVLDQHVKHYIRARHYVRYVDDFVVLGHSPQWLNAVHFDIREFLPAELGLRLNDQKTILQPIDRGIDFVGQIIKPWHRRVRRRVVAHAVRQIGSADTVKLSSMVNSYFGQCRQATKSLHDRVRIAKAVLRRGLTVNGTLTKT